MLPSLRGTTQLPEEIGRLRILHNRVYARIDFVTVDFVNVVQLSTFGISFPSSFSTWSRRYAIRREEENIVQLIAIHQSS